LISLASSSLQSSLIGAVDEVLGLFQPKAGDGAHFFDYLDLLRADFLEDRVVGAGAFVDGGIGARRGGHRTGHHHGGGGRHAELLFEGLDQFAQLEHRKPRDFFDNRFQFLCHFLVTPVTFTPLEC